MSAEQIIEAVMTNAFVRWFEVLAAPAWIWFRGRKIRNNWPKPIRVGFILMVVAACVILEEKTTALVKALTFEPQRTIRNWLDSRSYSSKLITGKDELFRFHVSGKEIFDVFSPSSAPGLIGFVYGIKINEDTQQRMKKLSDSDRKRLWVDIYLELARNKIFLPLVQPKEGVGIDVILGQSMISFSPDVSMGALDKELNSLKDTKYVLDVIFESFKSSGRL